MILGAEELVFGNLLAHLLSVLPTLLVLVVGLILVGVAGKRLPGRARLLAFIGGAVLLLGQLLAPVWVFLQWEVLGFSPHGFVPLIVGLLLALLHAAGIGLLIGALLAARTAPAAATASPSAPAMPAGASPAWPGTPTPHPMTPAPYPPAAAPPAPYPPAVAPPAPPQWTPPTS